MALGQIIDDKIVDLHKPFLGGQHFDGGVVFKNKDKQKSSKITFVSRGMCFFGGSKIYFLELFGSWVTPPLHRAYIDVTI